MELKSAVDNGAGGRERMVGRFINIVFLGPCSDIEIRYLRIKDWNTVYSRIMRDISGALFFNRIGMCYEGYNIGDFLRGRIARRFVLLNVAIFCEFLC